MWKFPLSARYKAGSIGRYAALLAVVLIRSSAVAQFTYTFTPEASTYTEVSAGGSDLNAIEVDDAHGASIPLGFAFGYAGASVTAVKVNSNGWISMEASDGPTAAQGRDNSGMAAAHQNLRPGIMALWDDLDGTGGTARYETTGALGSRVFTMEWRNWQWNFNATGITISFQCKLYEGSNVIEFIYRQESGAVNNTSGGASIGLLGTASGSYYSLNGTGASPTASTTTATLNLSTKPATGQLYRFTPAGCTGPAISSTTSNSPICATSTLNLSTVATGTAPYSYVWSGTGTFSDASIVSPSVTGAATGTYSLTVKNWCGASASGSIGVTVSAVPTTSAAGADQSVCTTVGMVTMAANTPTNGTGTWTQISGTAATITTAGSPTTTITGLNTAGARTFRWTVSNAPCAASTDDVVITMVAPPTVANAGVDKSICSTTGSSTMTANTATSGTGAWTQVSGPSSATITTASSPNTTITGLTSAGTYVFQWTITNAPCTASSDQVDVVVTAAPSVTTGSYGPICANAAAVALVGTPAGGTWSGPGVGGSTFAPGTAGAGAHVLTYTVTNSPCASVTARATVIVHPAPSSVTAGSSAAEVCSNANTVNLNSGGTILNSVILREDFNGPSNGWTTANNSTGGNASQRAAAAWYLMPDGYVYTNAGTSTTNLFHSNDDTQFYITNSDSTALTSVLVSTILKSPAFSTVGYVNASLNFFHHYRFNAGAESGKVEVSTDNSTWTTLSTIATTVGAPAGFASATVNLNAYAGQPTVYIRFLYTATFDWWWAVDNITVSGTTTPAFAWSSVPAGYSSNAQNPSSVAVPQNTNFIVTASTGQGCNTQASAPVSFTTAPNAGSPGSTTLCSNDPAVDLFSLLGGSPENTGTWSAGLTGGSLGTYTPGTSTPGTFTYTVAGTGPCPNDDATVSVVQNTAVDWYADTDGDGFGSGTSTGLACAAPNAGDVANNTDQCPTDANKQAPGQCGCGNLETDTDSDGTADCNDLCPNDANKIAPGICGCGVADTDSDGDGTANCNDGCPADPLKIAPGICGCGVADTDSDGDGTANCNDGCPADPLKIAPGICGCGVADTDTDGDGTADCNDLCPNDPLKVAPGQCGCGNLETDTDSDGTADCNDLCPNDPLKIAPGQCGCGNLETDTDSDGTADCNDLCPNDANKIAPGICGCGVADTDSDGDGIANCLDNCPNLYGQIGDACDDGDPNTNNDMNTATCTCAGTFIGTITEARFRTDNDGASTAWEVVPLAGGPAVCSGSGYGNNTNYTITCPLLDGCYRLRVYDANMDGMCCMNGMGGYILRTLDGKRIIDAENEGIFSGTAEVALGFCTPLGNDRLTTNRCDRENYLPSDFIQTVPSPAVQAQYGTGNQADDGYQFWIFDPNGGYSRRVLLTHATNNYYFPAGADRCSYLLMSSLVTSPIPQNKLLNVRVRSLVNGVYSAFGSACRLRVDLTNQCPTSQLDPTPGTKLSCGITNVLLNGSRTLWATYVSAGNKYQFEFSKSGYLRRITSPSSSLNLTVWSTLPLQYGFTYDVRVRVSFDNGANYCPFGAICQITTAAGPENQGHSMETTAVGEGLQMWPNPNGEGRVYLRLEGLNETTELVTVDIYDLMGAKVQTATLVAGAGVLNESIDLSNDIARGVYVVNVVADGQVFTQRLVVE